MDIAEHFELLTSQGVERATTRPVFVPVAQIEAHGPHLPVGTDLVIARWVCEAAATRAGGIVGPSLTMGTCHDFTCWPGYVVVDVNTFVGIVRGYVTSLGIQGFDRLLFFVPHGGNVYSSLVLATGEPATRAAGVRTFVACLPLLLGPQLGDLAGQADLDTSLMLAVRPDLVGSERSSPPQQPPGWLRGVRTTDPRHSLDTYFPDAVFADPSGSTAEIGRRVLDETVKRLAELASV